MSEQDGTPHPGRILLQRAMEPLGISRNQLARDLDVPVGRISDITNGKRGITADTALRLGRYFSTGPEIWLRMQAEYDLSVARASTWSAIVDRVRVLAEAEDVGYDDAYSPAQPPLPSTPQVEAAEPTVTEPATPHRVEIPETASPLPQPEPESLGPANPASSEVPDEPPALSAAPPATPVFASPASPARPLETAAPTVVSPPAPTGVQDPATSPPPQPGEAEDGPVVLWPVPPPDGQARSEERAGLSQAAADGAPTGNDDAGPEPVLELRESWIREEVPRDDDIGIPPVPGNRIENS